MKTQKYMMAPAVFLALVIVAAGCSGSSKKSEAPPPTLTETPEKIVKNFMSDLQFQNIGQTGLYFSSRIPEATRNGIAGKITATRRIGRFEAMLKTAGPLKDEDTEALVHLVFSSTDPALEYGASEKKVEKTTVRLLKESGLWKIRSIGIADVDEIIENDVFLFCLNAVMDATIAQEKVRLNSESYTTSMVELINAYSLDEMACEELSVSDADKDAYLLVARTANTVPCEITADTDSHSPESYEECKDFMKAEIR